MTGQVARIDRYLDLVPRPDAEVVEVGRFRLFSFGGAWADYARPVPAATTDDGSRPDSGDLARLVETCAGLGIRPRIEWIAETAPDLEAVVAEAGWEVERFPVLGRVLPAATPSAEGSTSGSTDGSGGVAGIVGCSPEAQTEARAIAEIGFAWSDPDPGPADLALVRTVAARLEETVVSRLVARCEAGQSVTAVAGPRPGQWVATGQHQPLEGVSEVVGLATLPAWRGQGYAAEVLDRLVLDAQSRGVDLLFVTAEGGSVVGLYSGAWFSYVCTHCAASQATTAD